MRFKRIIWIIEKLIIRNECIRKVKGKNIKEAEAKVTNECEGLLKLKFWNLRSRRTVIPKCRTWWFDWVSSWWVKRRHGNLIQ